MLSPMLSGAWRYRHFIFSSIKNEFRIRFARSRLGALWMILNPLAQVLIFAFILSSILSAKLPGINNKYAYALYLLSGMAAWSLFAEIMQRCLTLFIDNSNILKKLVFPRIALPLIVTGSALINNVLLLAAVIGIFAFLGHPLGIAIVWLPLVMCVGVAVGLGAGLLVGVLNVFIRDLAQIVPVLMQFLFWFTPIIYMPEILPSEYRHWIAMNPLAALVQGYQSILLYNRAPGWSSLGYIALPALLLLLLSLYVFRRASPEMVDQL